MRGTALVVALLVAAAAQVGCSEEGGPRNSPPTPVPVDSATKARWMRAAGVLTDACLETQERGGRERLEHATNTLLAGYAKHPDYGYPVEEMHGDGPYGAVAITLRNQLQVAATDARECAPELSRRLDAAVDE